MKIIQAIKLANKIEELKRARILMNEWYSENSKTMSEEEKFRFLDSIFTLDRYIAKYKFELARM